VCVVARAHSSFPPVRLMAGAGYPLDAPDRHKLRIYGTVSYRP
jgi:hypothetical protein